MSIARYHALERTSQKGYPFIGRCIQCGRNDLSMTAAHQYCENISQLSEEEALLLVIGPTDADPAARSA